MKKMSIYSRAKNNSKELYKDFKRRNSKVFKISDREKEDYKKLKKRAPKKISGYGERIDFYNLVVPPGRKKILKKRNKKTKPLRLKKIKGGYKLY